MKLKSQICNLLFIIFTWICKVVNTKLHVYGLNIDRKCHIKVFVYDMKSLVTILLCMILKMI